MNKTLIPLLEETIGRLCDGCRHKIAFNMAGSHGFGIDARPCKAIELRSAVKELKDADKVPTDLYIIFRGWRFRPPDSSGARNFGFQMLANEIRFELDGSESCVPEVRLR